MLLVASSDYISRSCCCSVHVDNNSTRSMSKSAICQYCVCTESLMNSFVHVGEVVSGWLDADPDHH